MAIAAHPDGPAGWRVGLYVRGRVQAQAAEGHLLVLCGFPYLVRDGVRHAVTPADLLASRDRLQPSLSYELQGEWSLVLLDLSTGACLAMVDRFGEQALYYTRHRDRLSFATEPFALLDEVPDAGLCEEALKDVFTLRVLSGRWSMLQGVHQVVPGQQLRIEGDHVTESPPQTPLQPFSADRQLTRKEAAQRLHEGIRGGLIALRETGVSSVVVPLSGGVDSSVIAAIARTIFPTCRAITVSYEGHENPELPRAIDVAARLGIELQTVPITSRLVEGHFRTVIDLLQEPPRHFNNVAMLSMLSAARNSADVVLAGDGVESLGIGGLGTALRLAQRKRLLQRIPGGLRAMIAAMARRVGGVRGRRFHHLVSRTLDELIVRTELIEMESLPSSAIQAIVGDGLPAADTLRRTYFPLLPVDERFSNWATTSLGRSLNRRNNRIGHWCGVRFEYPLLWPAVLDAARTFPVSMRFDLDRSLSKPVLRDVCASLVGEDVALWPKLGFYSPEVEWMMGPLRGAVDQALSPVRSRVASLLPDQGLADLAIRENKQLAWTLTSLHACMEAVQLRRSSTSE